MSARLLMHVWEFAGAAIALCTSPGSVELLLLTLGGVLPAKKNQARVESDVTFRVAFVVPAHDEESTIADCVKSLRECDSYSGDAAVYVVADNCTDQTAGLAAEAGANVLIRDDSARRGKGYALDFAFRKLLARGFNLFIVVDADSSVTRNLVRDFVKAFESGADAVQCRYKVRNSSGSMRTRWMNIALMAFNVLRPRGRERFGMSAGILGNGFALSQATLEKVPYDAVSVVEDLEYHLRLVRAGLTVRFVDTATVYGEMPLSNKGASTQRARWEGGRFRMIRESAPGLAREVCRGQFRLLEPLLELLLLPLGFHVLMLLFALTTPMAAVRYYVAAALTLVAAHILAAIAIGGGGWRDVGALFVAPLYLLWKLRIIPQLIRNSGRSTAWVRTERQTRQGGLK
jgi:cellulose synthase/poly-beta-1,6-N-acetylglucosamine synthase-like glycosyltransferase